MAVTADPHVHPPTSCTSGLPLSSSSTDQPLPSACALAPPCAALPTPAPVHGAGSANTASFAPWATARRRLLGLRDTKRGAVGMPGAGHVRGRRCPRQAESEAGRVRGRPCQRQDILACRQERNEASGGVGQGPQGSATCMRWRPARDRQPV
eukprot:353404-Chlamydomonas_euryale.AAC.6